MWKEQILSINMEILNKDLAQVEIFKLLKFHEILMELVSRNLNGISFKNIC